MISGLKNSSKPMALQAGIGCTLTSQNTFVTTNTLAASFESNQLSFTNPSGNVSKINNTLVPSTGANVTVTLGVPDVTVGVDAADYSDASTDRQRFLCGFCDVDSDGTIGFQYPSGFVTSVSIVNKTYNSVTMPTYQFSFDSAFRDTNLIFGGHARVTDFSEYIHVRGGFYGSPTFAEMLVHKGSTDTFTQGPFTAFFFSSAANL